MSMVGKTPASAPAWSIRLREARDDKGLNQEELAARCDTTQTTVSEWESGKTKPKMAVWPLIKTALGVGMDEILFGEKTSPGQRGGSALLEQFLTTISAAIERDRISNLALFVTLNKLADEVDRDTALEHGIISAPPAPRTRTPSPKRRARVRSVHPS